MKNILILALTVLASVSFAQPKKQKAPPLAPQPVVGQPMGQHHTTKTSSGFSRNYGLAGCGLGSVLLGKKGGQLFAGTTNGTAGNQTFGITSGTLNCVDSATSEVAGRMDQFILVNRSQLQGDVARGQGETIAAISSYMGCETASTAIGTELKNNYSTIFNGDVKANEITDGIITVIKSQPALAQQCGNLS